MRTLRLPFRTYNLRWSPASPISQGELDYTVVLTMVQKINNQLGDMNVDNDKIRSVCDGLLRDYQPRDEAITNLTRLVKEAVNRPATHRPHQNTTGPHAMVPTDIIDADENLRAVDIGITWQGSETFLHGVKVVGPHVAGPQLRSQPATSTPYMPVREHAPCHMSSPPPTQPLCVDIPDRQGYRPATPIQRFNNKTLNWPAWFRHFKPVADVHDWDWDQRALQLVPYMDETAMNVIQELVDDELYDYDTLVKLLSDRFDPASRVSASRSRFHGRMRRHHEDAYADAITELCRVGYPQSPPELHQEFISEQFVRGQSDPELMKYLWVVIRTQKDRKLQTLIEVCTDFTSLGQPTTVHRPVEQVFAMEEEEEPEDMVALMEQSQWTGRGITEPQMSPSLQQMFALARRMDYEMRPISRHSENARQTPNSQRMSGQIYRAPLRQGRDYSKVKCFSCGQMGHTQARCPKPDQSLPFRPDGWNSQPDGPRQRPDGPQQGNGILTGNSPIPVCTRFIWTPDHLHRLHQPILRDRFTHPPVAPMPPEILFSSWIRM